ncbi:MAG: TetR/AcrR family transcriptional regulator [Bacteroidales bacterium]
MPIKDCQTKKLIIETAMKVFFAEGRIYATTQNIADEAGVNRTLINYYFRSKKSLLAIAIKTTRKEFIRNSDLILSSDLPFKEKTERFIDDFMNNLLKYPYLESFVTADLIQRRLMKNAAAGSIEKQPAPIKQYLEKISEEMEAGNMPKNNPVHFMMNIFSLMIYPIIMKPLQMSILNLSETEYQKILYERKKVILELLFSSEDAKEKFKNQN